MVFAETDVEPVLDHVDDTLKLIGLCLLLHLFDEVTRYESTEGGYKEPHSSILKDINVCYFNVFMELVFDVQVSLP